MVGGVSHLEFEDEMGRKDDRAYLRFGSVGATSTDREEESWESRLLEDREEEESGDVRLLEDSCLTKKMRVGIFWCRLRITILNVFYIVLYLLGLEIVRKRCRQISKKVAYLCHAMTREFNDGPECSINFN